MSVYDRGQASGTSYIAMEYLNGPTLKDEITSRAPLPEAEVVNWATQALDALEFAHRQGVVHRDIKPHNMVLTDEGRLKVTDFGIARAANVQQMTEVGSIVGTAQYLSPEQARGLDVGPQSDLYSMGIVVYEMLTGELPFTGDSAVEIAMKQVSDPPPSIRKQNRLVSEGLEQVVMRSLSKDPALRHASARQMADELRRVSRGGAVSSDTQMATRVLTGGAAAAAAYTGAQTSVLPPGGTKPPPERREPAAQRPALAARPRPSDGERGCRLRRLQAALGRGRRRADAERQLPNGQGAARRGSAEGNVPGQGVVARQEGRRRGQRPERRIERRQELDRHDLHRRGPECDHGPGRSWQVRLGGDRHPHSRGFQVDPAPINVDSAKVGAGRVVGTTPKAGSPEPQGTTIQLRVATGNVVVPDVTGLSCDEATAKMKQRTLVATCQDQPSDQPVPGKAFSSTRGCGCNRAAELAVTVLISSGPQQVTVPPVVGETKQDAVKALHDVGLRAAIHRASSAPTPRLNNTIQSQNPTAGAQVDQEHLREHRRPQVPAQPTRAA